MIYVSYTLNLEIAYIKKMAHLAEKVGRDFLFRNQSVV